MTVRCVSGKKIFNTESIAEEVLLELWTKNDYAEKHAPIAIYRCDDCGLYHLTSRPPMNEKLSKYLSSRDLKLNKEANRWIEKLKKK